MGLLSRAHELLARFETGPNPFDGGKWAGRVRHVAPIVRRDRLYIFFSGIGDAPERILLSTIVLSSDWSTWRASPPVEVLRPMAAYECTDIPIVPSKAGEAEGPEHALRDPGVIEEKKPRDPVLLVLRGAGDRRGRCDLICQVMARKWP